MPGGYGSRPALARLAIGVALLVAVAAFVYEARLVDVVTGHQSFRAYLIVNGLDAAQPFLLFAGVVLAGPALGARHRFILAGATLAVIGAAIVEALLGWFFRIADLGAILAENPQVLEGIQVANAAGRGLEALGAILIAWGVGRPGFRAPRGTVRIALLSVVGLAAAAGVAGAIPLYVTMPDVSSAVFLAAVVVTVVNIAALGITALVALASAVPGPPLDWRWPVGIGLGIAVVTGAGSQWTSIVSTGGVLGDWWWTWQRALGVGGGLLAAAGFAIAAYVRWPAVPSRLAGDELSASRS